LKIAALNFFFFEGDRPCSPIQHFLKNQMYYLCFAVNPIVGALYSVFSDTLQKVFIFFRYKVENIYYINVLL